MGVSGFLVDVTEAVRRTTAREVDEAMELMSQSRPAIEQAKGALMVTYGLDPDEAFLLLRRYSQQVNVKVRDVARNIVEALPRRRPARSARGPPGTASRRRLPGARRRSSSPGA